MLYRDSTSGLWAGEEEVAATLLFVARRCVINILFHKRNHCWGSFHSQHGIRGAADLIGKVVVNFVGLFFFGKEDVFWPFTGRQSDSVSLPLTLPGCRECERETDGQRETKKEKKNPFWQQPQLSLVWIWQLSFRSSVYLCVYACKCTMWVGTGHFHAQLFYEAFHVLRPQVQLQLKWRTDTSMAKTHMF